MLDLTIDEFKALRIVELRAKKRQEKWPGSWGHFNWKKIGLSTAKFKDARVCRESMPTEKAKAAFDFLTRPDELDEHGGILRRHGNRFYKEALEEQRARLTGQKVLWISSFDLFVNCKGIECAMESLAVISWNLRSGRAARLERLEPLLRTQIRVDQGNYMSRETIRISTACLVPDR